MYQVKLQFQQQQQQQQQQHVSVRQSPREEVNSQTITTNRTHQQTEEDTPIDNNGTQYNQNRGLKLYCSK